MNIVSRVSRGSYCVTICCIVDTIFDYRPMSLVKAQFLDKKNESLEFELEFFRCVANKFTLLTLCCGCHLL